MVWYTWVMVRPDHLGNAERVNQDPLTVKDGVAQSRADAYKWTKFAICKQVKIGRDGDMDNPLKYFAELRDPRVERNREHLLEEILFIAIAAVLSGAESWNDIADYGLDKAGVAEDLSATARRHPFARHLQPRLRGTGPGRDGTWFLLPGLPPSPS